MIGWLGGVFLRERAGAPLSPAASSSLKRWRRHVQRFFYRLYAGMRIEELFGIIRGEPGWEAPRPAPPGPVAKRGHPSSRSHGLFWCLMQISRSRSRQWKT